MRLSLAFLLLSLTLATAQNVTVQVGGRTVGTRGVLNFESANGIVQACRDDAANNRITCMPSSDYAVVATHESVHNNENYCVSTNRSTSYACQISYGGLMAYHTGMTVLLSVDAPCTAACTLDIGTLGPVGIKLADGATDPGGALAAGQPQWLFYDGSVFRMMGGSGGGSAAAERSRERDVLGRRFIAAMETMTYSPVISLEVTAGDLHKTTTNNEAGNATINAATGGLPGQHMWILVVNDLVSGKTITFGANLKSAGPLTGTPGKSATVQFVSDGAAWYEVARTANL